MKAIVTTSDRLLRRYAGISKGMEVDIIRMDKLHVEEDKNGAIDECTNAIEAL